jgi:phosphate transport system protein
LAIHLLRDLEKLKKHLLAVGALVEEAVGKATEALLERRLEYISEVVEGDDRIDREEVLVDEDCLKILALHQPVASDLRFIIAAMKVNNDLERMADRAVNIAELAAVVAAQKSVPGMELAPMAAWARTMVRESLDAFVRLDSELARKVLGDDDRVDRHNAELFQLGQKLMREDPSSVEYAVHVMSASLNYERIADLATNVAEDVLFMVDGEVVRHQA